MAAEEKRKGYGDWRDAARSIRSGEEGMRRRINHSYCCQSPSVVRLLQTSFRARWTSE